MNIYFSIFICLLPLFLVEFFTIFILKLKSPKYALALVLGFFSVLLPAFLISLVNNFLGFSPNKIQTIPLLLFYNLFFVALIEELVKFLATKTFFAILLKTENLKKQWLFLALSLGVAFGVGESIFYFAEISHFSVLRPFTAVLLHGVCTCICAKSFFIKKIQTEILNKAYFLAASTILHGLYNFFTTLGDLFNIFSILILLFSLYSAFFVLKEKT